MSAEWFCANGCKSADDCKQRADGTCVYEYDAKQYEPHLRWKGEGAPPARWWAGGTLVYRTFSDFCD